VSHWSGARPSRRGGTWSRAENVPLA
jgi:hypothetical protein